MWEDLVTYGTICSLFYPIFFFAFFLLPHVHRGNNLHLYGRKKRADETKLKKFSMEENYLLFELLFCNSIYRWTYNVQKERMFLLDLRVEILSAKWAVEQSMYTDMCFDFAIDKLWYYIRTKSSQIMLVIILIKWPAILCTHSTLSERKGKGKR